MQPPINQVVDLIVAQVDKVEPKAFNGMDKTYFTTPEGYSVYTFIKNVNVGQPIRGLLLQDKAMTLQLKRDPNAGFGGASAPVQATLPGTPAPVQTPAKAPYKAANAGERNTSIERQSSVKAAIEIVRDFYDKHDPNKHAMTLDNYTDLVLTQARRVFEGLDKIDRPMSITLDDLEAAARGEKGIDEL